MMWYRNVGPMWWPALTDAVRSHETTAFEVGSRVWSAQRTEDHGALPFDRRFPPSRQLHFDVLDAR